MKPQLHSPPMSSPGRLIAACLAVVAAGLLMLGCGSGNEVKVDLPQDTVQAITDKLDQIQERFAAGDCTGSNSAQTSLDALRSAIDGLDVDEQFVSDMNQMLDNLDEQIATQCDPATRTTSSTTEPTDTLPTTTEPTTTESTTTTTTTTKSTTKDTSSTTTTTTTTPPTGPPGNPGNPNGNGPGGGVVPGKGKKDNSGQIKKPKPGKGVKAQDEQKGRSR